MSRFSFRNAFVFLVSVAIAVGVAFVYLTPFGRRLSIGWWRPFLSGSSAAVDEVQQLSRGSARTVSEPADIAGLKEHLVELEIALANASDLKRENDELRVLAGLPPRAGWRRVTGSVIARDPASWDRTFRIDRGEADGLGPGNVVLVGADVAGRIGEVTPHTSLVYTVLDARCRLSVVVEGAAASGVSVGRGPTMAGRSPLSCVINFLPHDRFYEIGQTVVTSGLGTAIPGGLRVGCIVPWDDQSDINVQLRTYVQIRCRPYAVGGRPSFVSILCPAPDATAAAGGSPE